MTDDTALILFVDDEPSILSGVRRLLRRHAAQWRLQTVDSAADALRLMAAEPVDVLVTDMRMPQAGGAWLLEQSRRLHPATARMVLSGEADQGAVIAAAGPTHRYLAKPCSPDDLEYALTQTLAAARLLDDPRLRALLAGQSSLPKPVRVWEELRAVIADPEVDLPRIATVIESDLATTAEVLKLVNSSFFALASHVTTVERAITLLGTQVIQSLVLAGALFAPTVDLPDDLDSDQLRAAAVDASLRVRHRAQEEGWDAESTDAVALAALLHDVGLLVLASDDRAAWHRYRTLGEPQDRDAQTEIFGCPVPRASAYLLGLWGFAPDTVAALAHQPLDLDDAQQRLTATPAETAVRQARRTASPERAR